jgi:3-phenylpropionate/cinnamic acid dioxygenase small subunit
MTMDADAKHQITELLARAAYALDTKNLQMLEAGFAEDANFTLTIEGVAEVSRFEGREAIMGLMKGALDVQTDERRHGISNIFYEQVGKDRATVVSYLTLTATEGGAINLITTGIYTDEVVRQNGAWVVKDRSLKLDRPY